ncbi:hypothetical protein E2C01_022989 [Portunus trituberculatus]|uniref:Uncharacterized protein n=1 Tax=Portunus trituberculatus TaxID=210409 RepID=A0A5B7E8K0_PORTR|nr:hypothetical protein [Portunus trituberculatus]
MIHAVLCFPSGLPTTRDPMRLQGSGGREAALHGGGSVRHLPSPSSSLLAPPRDSLRLPTLTAAHTIPLPQKHANIMQPLGKRLKKVVVSSPPSSSSSSSSSFSSSLPPLTDEANQLVSNPIPAVWQGRTSSALTRAASPPTLHIAIGLPDEY